MKYHTLWGLSLTVTVFLSSCARNNLNIGYIEIIDAPLLEITSPSKVLNNTHAFTSPDQIIIADSILVIYDAVNQIYPIHLFDTTGRMITPLGAKGKGPGEVINPQTPRYNQNTKSISLYDWSGRKIVNYNLTKAIQNEICYSEVKLPIKTYSVFDVFPWKNKYLFLSNNSETRFGVLDNDSIRTVYSRIPRLVENQEENASIWLYAYCSALKPDNSRLAMGTYIGTVMEILDISNLENIKQTAFLPISEPVYGIAEGAKPTWVTIDEGTIRGFSSMYATDQYIYAVVLNNLRQKEYDATQSGNNQISVFNWDGKPICKLKLDRHVTTIAVDESHGKIYAFSYPNNEDGPELISFDFNINNLPK